MSVVNVKNFAYNTNDLIGKGATGSVYKGVDSYNGRVVAIKAIKMSSINNDVTKYLLQNQLKALQVADHPNIIKNYDIVRNKDFTYIVMEHCSSNLADFIKSKRFIPEEKAMQLFKQIVEGYRCLREHRIIHRDLKPSNILLTHDLIPKISDFGYCEIEGFLPKPKMFYNVGSPSYMPPEAITKNIYSQKSDIWALGTILYEMVNGQTYDKGKQVMEAVMNIGKRGITHVKPISPQTQGIIKQCLGLDPAKRINLIRLRELLNLEHSDIRNTSVYKDDSIMFQQPSSFAFGHQGSIIKNHPNQNNQNSFFDHHGPNQLTINRSNPVFKSLILPHQHQQIQDPVIHPLQTQNIKRSFIDQQQISKQTVVTPVVNSHPPQSNIHQILQNHGQKTPTNIRSVIPQQQPSISQISQIDRARNNPFHTARRSHFEQPQKRFFSVSPNRQNEKLNHQAFTKRKMVHLNTSVDEISPQMLVSPQINRGSILRHKI